METKAADTLARDDRFLDLVDFKWLMACVGRRVDLPRLQRDTAYAGECALQGLTTDSEFLRRRSRELLALLAQ
ncbi:MAG TPA: hypothetical protein VGP22_02795 [Albitalea sp.]|jgi:hypothetical protein|nr:hypothetical protein [Albitalea sp.]